MKTCIKYITKKIYKQVMTNIERHKDKANQKEKEGKKEKRKKKRKREKEMRG